MRVTKTIREFIEKEVSNRLDAKYTAEKEEPISRPRWNRKCGKWL